MRPKTFAPADLLYVLIATGITGTLGTALLWNRYRGAPVDLVGTVLSCAVMLGCVGFLLGLWWSRRKRLSHYRYTVLGLHHFYDDDVPSYHPDNIAWVLTDTADRWARHYERMGEPMVARRIRRHEYWAGACVWMRDEQVFHVQQDTRLYAGATYGNAALVGVGTESRPLQHTAYQHEVSHVLLNAIEGRRVPEAEAHRVFRAVGIG